MLGQRASVHAKLWVHTSGRSIVSLAQSSLGPGSLKLSLRLPASYRKALAPRLSLSLTISVDGASRVNRTSSARVFLIR